MAWSWDPAKNSANRRKHGLSFEIASLVFQDRLAVTVDGVEHGRIISARKATVRETGVYFHGG